MKIGSFFNAHFIFEKNRSRLKSFHQKDVKIFISSKAKNILNLEGFNI